MPESTARESETGSHSLLGSKKFIKRLSLWAVVIAVYVWSAYGTNLSVTEFVRGYPFMKDFIIRMIPPDTGILKNLIKPVIETVQIALWGTTLAIILSIPLGIFAAQNTSPHPVVYQFTRMILNSLRAISEFIFALIFVAAVGLGPFPGVLALGIHSAGMLGKFYAEAIENVDRGAVEALEAAAAHKLQIIIYAVAPQVLPEFITYNLYRFEHNLRQATVLGMVGAGGLGFELITSMRLFKYQETATILLVILFTVTVVDYFSSKIRARFI